MWEHCPCCFSSSKDSFFIYLKRKKKNQSTTQKQDKKSIILIWLSQLNKCDQPVWDDKIFVCMCLAFSWPCLVSFISPPFTGRWGVINVLCFLYFTALKYKASVAAASCYWNHGETGRYRSECVLPGRRVVGLGEPGAWCQSMGTGRLGHSSSALTGSLTARLPRAPCLRRALVKTSLLTDPALLLLGCFKLTR